MIIDCVSDLHGYYPELEGGDLLILAGDYTLSDRVRDWAEFFSWLRKQNYRKKILIAGNHDNFLQNGFPRTAQEAHDLREVREFLSIDYDDIDFEYLCDSGTEFEGLKIWGSPWTQTFTGMNPRCMAFTYDTEEELEAKWSMIPEDTDILITHSPPYGILDGIEQRNETLLHVGSTSLRKQVLSNRLPNLRFHIFGHIHLQGGKRVDTTLTSFVNCSILNEDYDPVNKPVRVVYER